jgi:MFS family permease
MSESPADLSRPLTGPRSALRVAFQPNFGPYFIGNFISMCGTWFQMLAQAILIYRLTGSSFLVGVVNFSLFAGVFVLAPWSGSAADRFDRRRLLAGTQLVMAVTTALLAALAWGGMASTGVVVAFALVLGFATAFAIPARQALIPSLVERTDLAQAIALNSVTFNLARAVGPVGAAIVVDRFGIPWAFAINSVSYFALIIALGMIRPVNETPRPETRPKLAETFREVRRDKHLVILFITVAAVSISADPVSTLTPAFATEIFGRADTVAGLLVGAYGAGAVAAAFFFAGRVSGSYRRMAATLLLLSGGMVVFAHASTLALGVVALFVSGFGYLATNTSATSILQLEVADAHRGRVMALWSIAFLGSRPIASLTDGAIASGAGLRVAATVMAIPALVGAVLLVRAHARTPARAVREPWGSRPGEEL